MKLIEALVELEKNLTAIGIKSQVGTFFSRNNTFEITLCGLETTGWSVVEPPAEPKARTRPRAARSEPCRPAKKPTAEGE